VIVHETVGVAGPVTALVDREEDAEEGLPIAVILEDRPLFVPPRSDVVHGSGVFDAHGAGHNGRISGKKEKVKE